MKTLAALAPKRGCECGGTCGFCSAKAEPGHGRPFQGRVPAVQGYNFEHVAIFPAPTATDIPGVDEEGDDDVSASELPTGGDTPAGGGDATEAADSCSQPFSMTKIVSGAFQGGLTLYDYYPKATDRGSGAAGPFDTGTRAGATAQLIGTFPSPCRPDQFSLAQTVTYTKKIRNGAHDPKEGVVQDDIAKSRRDASKAPFRQDWLGGGLNSSMADPPNVAYSPTDNIEADRDFTTSLVGAGGRKSVNWSTSIRIVNGTVTRNTIS